MGEQGMERRDFLKAAGVLGAAAAGVGLLAGCTKGAGGTQNAAVGGVDPSRIDWTYEADLVIVGSGSAGYCAAIEAAEAGSSVLLLEKNVALGGNSQLCGGVILGAGWSTQEQITGYKGDTGEAFADQMLRWAQGFGNAEVIRETCMRSADAIDWMISLGRNFDAAEILPPIWKFDTEADIVPRSLWLSAEISDPEYKPGAGNGHFTTLKMKADELKTIEAKTEVEVKRLIRSTSGEIVGVEAAEGSKTVYAKAHKAVVLACASVDNNTEMARKLGLMQQYWAMTLADNKLDSVGVGIGAVSPDMPTNTGDGVRMAMEAGADLLLSQACVMNDAHYIGGVAEYYTATGHESNRYRSYKSEGTILVNRAGRRFVQEDAEWGYVISECSKEVYSTGWQPGKPSEVNVYVMCDADHLWQWQMKGIDATSKTVVSADTIEGLAEKLGIPAENLADEINRWNTFCATGKDLDFDRRVDFGTIKTPPFYADPMRPGTMGTYAGVRSNIKAEVLAVSGDPIPRLYAAGAVAGGNYCGPFYPGCGWAILNTVVWGREAGKNAAALTPWDA